VLVWTSLLFGGCGGKFGVEELLDQLHDPIDDHGQLGSSDIISRGDDYMIAFLAVDCAGAWVYVYFMIGVEAYQEQ